MKNRIDNILLGILWLLAVALGASFWFNTKFGFDIFSAAHWQYLGYMQAHSTPVRTSFYVSIVIMVCAMLGGLYMLAWPRLRRLHRMRRAEANEKHITAPAAATPTATPPNPTPATKTDAKPTTPGPVLQRPPRPNIKIPANAYTAAPAVTPAVPAAKPDHRDQWPQMREIFASAGYTVKNNPKIVGVQTALIAIGLDEVLWIGAIGVSTDELNTAIEKMENVFSDTLDDVEITVNGFILNPTDTPAPESGILTFDSMDQLRDYISQHPNPPTTPDDAENFDAYSAYITTVIEYIGKI